MLVQKARSHQVARYFYQILVLDLTNHARTVEGSSAFCISLLSGLKQVQAEVLQLWAENFDQILPEISSQADFSVAVRTARILEHKQLDPDASQQLLNKLSQKITQAMQVLPDDLWRVRILTQLTQRCISNVFARLDADTAESIKSMSHNAVGGEKILKAIGEYQDDD